MKKQPLHDSREQQRGCHTGRNSGLKSTMGCSRRFENADSCLHANRRRAVAAMVQQTTSTFGQLNMAFNNAGIHAPVAETADALGEKPANARSNRVFSYSR